MKTSKFILLSLALSLVVSMNNLAHALDYLIGAGDVLEVSVFQQPDMKAIKTVSASGDISFPLAGLVRVAGKSEHDAEDAISTALARSRVINNPEVAVRILEYRSATVAVDGFVANPGEFPVIGFLTIHQLISKAGGLAEGANPMITIYRNGGSLLKVDLLDIYQPGAVAKDYSIKAGDRVFVEAMPEPPVFYTYGAVTKNGRYELTENMTVMQALALSGGRTESATRSKVKIFRSLNTGAGGLNEIDASEEDLVQADDVILIEESRF